MLELNIGSQLVNINPDDIYSITLDFDKALLKVTIQSTESNDKVVVTSDYSELEINDLLQHCIELNNILGQELRPSGSFSLTS